jgi:glyoxylase I family protein
MQISFIDHIVIIVKDIKETEKFYSSFLGLPEYQAEETVVYKIGHTKVFFVLPHGGFEKTNKDKGGLNHIVFGVRTLEELKSFEVLLNKTSIQHSGIKTDKYGNKEFVWFDDPGDIRVEIYCPPLDE